MVKVTSRGFEISEIGEKITSIVSDGDGSFSILSRNLISGSGEQSANLPIGEVDALIEALQEAKRLLGGAPPERKLLGLRDRTGDLWHNLGGDLFSVTDDDLPEDGRTRENIVLHWGPVTEVWSTES